VNPENGMKAIYELERAVKDLGLKGVLILPYAVRKPINDKILYPFTPNVASSMCQCIFRWAYAPLLPSEVGRRLYRRGCLVFSGTQDLASHIGYPWTDEMIAMAWKHTMCTLM